MSELRHCRLCGGNELELVADFGKRPIAHRLLSARDQAEDLHPMSLHLCAACGLIQVVDPIDPDVLYGHYNFNFSSWKPEPHQSDELDSIMAHGPYEAACDIGCNDGLFLNALRERGVGRLVGIEPNPVSGKIASERGIEVVRGMVSPAVCDEAIARNGGRFDLIVSRQVIEHVLDLENFFACIDKLLSPAGVLFLDMPDFEPSLRMADCTAVWEEHVSYFSKPVLFGMLKRFGFAPVSFDWYDFSSGALAVVARRADGVRGSLPSEDSITDIVELARGFGTKIDTYNRQLRSGLARARNSGAEIALYGVGVRGCCAINGLRFGDLVDFAVDDQKERQGYYLPGARLEIRPFSALSGSDRPLICLLAVNNENDEKVASKLVSQLKRPVRAISLCSPKDISKELLHL